MLRNFAFCVNDCYNFTNVADLTVFSEYFSNCSVNRTRYFNYRFIVLYFHDDIVVSYLVPNFDVHLDDFAFVKAFA
ncbi:hypothetical protein D3C73_1384470 [compost metagenome]